MISSRCRMATSGFAFRPLKKPLGLPRTRARIIQDFVRANGKRSFPVKNIFELQHRQRIIVKYEELMWFGVMKGQKSLPKIGQVISHVVVAADNRQLTLIFQPFNILKIQIHSNSITGSSSLQVGVPNFTNPSYQPSLPTPSQSLGPNQIVWG